MHIIGVDMGDALLVRIEPGHAPKVVATNKTTTSRDVFSGVLAAIQQVYQESDVAAVMVGTTHFINALIQRKHLAKVCTLRLCGSATHSLPPMSNWPDGLKHQVDGLTACVSGGYFYDGSPIRDLNEDEIRQLVRQARDRDIQSFCVAGVFSPCRPDQEERVAEIILEESPNVFITLSHKIAGLGLFERENASILNACLRPLALRTIKALEKALPVGLPLFLTQNNGTLLSLEQCAQFPILTFASGSTNSMLGAAHLTGIENGIVIDIGGTSTDIGVLINGRPRQTHAAKSEIGGANGLRCFLVGAAKQLPCIDCDLMGRAFPRLDHSLPFITGQPVTPTCLTDVRGRTVLYTPSMIPNAEELEETLRKECIKMGLRGALCLPPLTGEQVQEHTILHTISQAWFLGRTKFAHPTDIIRAVVEVGEGEVLITNGKVINVERYTTTGFARSHIQIEVEGKILIIDFQNENLVARYGDDQIIASVPDLIRLVEQDSGEPLSTENVKYGCRVSVLVLPAPLRMTTPEALAIVGPQAFGYKYQYTPKPNQEPLKSVWDVFYNKTVIPSSD